MLRGDCSITDRRRITGGGARFGRRLWSVVRSGLAPIDRHT
ncbi:MAG: hypothetical protein JHC63_05725 [Acidimicrobiia bacterium]|nr:hypothetical protein [Acidimicrobiia bacterium]